MANKQIIWIGEGCCFPDSLSFFKENACDITVIKTKNTLPWFINNYSVFNEIGIDLVDYDEENIKKIFSKLDENTLVIGGGNFGGNVPSSFVFENFQDIGYEELEILAKIAEYNHQNSCKAHVVRYFNGDTGFGSQQAIDTFTEKTKYVDTFLFDNDSLRDFVLTNIPTAKDKKLLLGWIETPLRKTVFHNTGKIERRYISLGRCLCNDAGFIKEKLGKLITYYPIARKSLSRLQRLKWRIIGKKRRYNLAGAVKSSCVMEKDRQLFNKFESSCAFGLSHMHDIFFGSIADWHKNKNYYWSLEGQNKAFMICDNKEAYYQFSNNPNKDVCYLMNGIIPLISHMEHNVYREMVEKKMAILIQKKEDIEAVLKLSDKEIQQYRDNIYANQDLFTFDHVGEMLINLLER